MVRRELRDCEDGGNFRRPQVWSKKIRDWETNPQLEALKTTSPNLGALKTWSKGKIRSMQDGIYINLFNC